MKYPHEINTNFFELLLSSGWVKERDIVLDKLPNHLEEMPTSIKIFLRELWYISFARKFFSLSSDDDYIFHTIIYTFGETISKLEDYSVSGEYTDMYNNLVDCKIRNFGYQNFREILIDENGRIYILPDSGDLYVFKGRFYEALYNLIYEPYQSFLVGDNFELFKDNENFLEKTGLFLKDI